MARDQSSSRSVGASIRPQIVPDPRESRIRELEQRVAELEMQLASQEVTSVHQINPTIEIERTRAIVERALRTSESHLKLLSHVASQLAKAEPPEQLFHELGRVVMEHLGCQYFFNFLVDNAKEKLRLNACAGLSKEQAESIEWLEFGVPVCGRVAEEGKSIVVEDALAPDQAELKLIRSYGIQAYCCHPLVGQGQVFGTFSVGAVNRKRFERDEVDLLRAVTDQLATAIQRFEAQRELRRSHAHLLEANRRKTEFLAVLSHELRNPLAPIVNSLYILDRAAPGGEQVTRAKAVINRQVTQIAKLVDDLLDLTRVTRNRIQLRFEHFDLNDIVARALEDHRSLFGNAGVRLELTLAPVPLFVRADRTRVVQIVGNLLQNAAKFTLAGGRTTVSLRQDGTQALLRVSDDGVGMEPEILDSLFQPFAQAAQSLERSRGGLGLGLALVKELVLLHGGTVVATSDGPGLGSRFSVRLPLDQASEATRPSEPSTAKPASRRVLVVEDNIDAAESLKDVLEIAGHEVAVAHNGFEGIARARSLKPEVVLCDLGLPGMDGFGLARTLRADETMRNVTLVAVSGYALPEDLERAKEAGFDHHLAKPPSIERLEEILART